MKFNKMLLTMNFAIILIIILRGSLTVYANYDDCALEDTSMCGERNIADALPCCLFNDTTMCNFQTTDISGYSWISSLNYEPFYDPPDPGSSYAVFETVNYNGSQNLYVILESPTITVNYDSVFTAKIYAIDQYQQSSATSLLISFYNDQTGESVLMEYVKDTSGSWINIAFYCESAHGRCCVDNQCTGKIQITALVGSNGGSVFYGIDAFEIDNACSKLTSIF